MLLVVAAGSVQAAKLTKSFTATFCFAQREEAPAGVGQATDPPPVGLGRRSSAMPDSERPPRSDLPGRQRVLARAAPDYRY